MKQKILIIPSFLPYPLNTGGNIGVFEMINYFREKYDLSLIVSDFSGKITPAFIELKALWPDVDIYVFKRTFLQRVSNSLFYKLQKLFYKFFKKRYFQNTIWYQDESNLVENAFNYTEHFSDRTFVNYVNDIIKSKTFDLIQVEFYGNISLPVFLKSNCPIIFIHHELRFVRKEREFVIIAPDDKYLKAMLAQMKAYEIEMLKNYDKVVLLSEVDKIILSPYLPEHLLYVSPLGIKKKTQNVANENYSFNNTLSFLGGGVHYPNRDGLIWFIENGVPLLKDKLPAIKLQIIGQWDSDFRAKYESDDIKFPGFVENLDEALVNSIMIVPVRIGSGIRMKIIEAVNLGIPFVTTSVGVEGLDFRDKTDCFIADDICQFVESIIDLISNVELQTSFIKNAQAQSKELFSFEIAMRKRQELYNSILSDK